MTLSQAFGTALRQARKKKDKNQQAAAELCRISPRQLGNLEQGISAPSAETIVRAYRAFGVDIYALEFDLTDKE